MSSASVLRDQIAGLVRQYHQQQFSNQAFEAGTDLVHYAGRVFDADELCALVDASLDFFLTANRYAERFEADFADYIGVSDAILVNSGSSANLVALTALTSPKLGDRRLKPGDEVVTVAAGFPTTLAPIAAEQPGAGVRRRPARRLHRGSRSAAGGDRSEDARHHDGAHAGRAVRSRHRDGSRAGATTSGSSRTTATRSDRATAAGSPGRSATWRRVSFYPAHHITMGEGGAVVTNDRHARDGRAIVPRLGARLLLRRRREQHLRHAVQPAVRHAAVRLRSQVRLQPRRLQPEGDRHAGGDRLRAAREADVVRREAPMPTSIACWRRSRPTKTGCCCRRRPTHAEPSWFGFVITVRENAGFTRADLVKFLEANRVETRSLFAGNLLRHPAFQDDSAPRRGRPGQHRHRDEPTRSSSACIPVSTTARLDYMACGVRQVHAWANGDAEAAVFVERVVAHGERVYTLDAASGAAGAAVPRRTVPASRARPVRSERLLARVACVLDREPSRASATRVRITYAVHGRFTARMERDVDRGTAGVDQDALRRLRRSTAARTSCSSPAARVSRRSPRFWKMPAPAASERIVLAYGARTADLLIYRDVVERCASRTPVAFRRVLRRRSRRGRLRARHRRTGVGRRGLADAGAARSRRRTTSRVRRRCCRPSARDLRARNVAPEAIHIDAWE